MPAKHIFIAAQKNLKYEKIKAILRLALLIIHANEVRHYNLVNCDKCRPIFMLLTPSKKIS